MHTIFGFALAVNNDHSLIPLVTDIQTNTEPGTSNGHVML